MYYTSVLSTKTTLFPAKFAIHGHNHGNKACQSTDGIGNRLRNKHTMHAQSKQIRQDQSQRNYDNNLSENREKHRMFCLSKCRKRRLSAKLKRHKEKSEEIQMHCRNSKRQRITTSAKHPDKRSRNRGNQPPDCQCIHDRNSRHGPNRLFHTLIFLCTVVVAKHRLTGAGKSLHRQRNNLPHRIDNCHNADIHISAVGLQRRVAHHLYR